MRCNHSLTLFTLLPVFTSPVWSFEQVFAHYMVGTVTASHAVYDVTEAKAMGIDGFALNVGDPTQAFVKDTLASLFSAADNAGFKLYISVDVYASGDACYKIKTSCKGPNDYAWIFSTYKGHPAYYDYNSKPVISTFSSGGFTHDYWKAWKTSLANEMFFIPDFDETEGYYAGADGWWSYWGDLVDGIFSWESAWPERAGFGGDYPGDVTVDVPPLNAAHKRKKYYMLGLSSLQYKNAYGTNVFRPGDLTLPKRMAALLSMSS